MTGTPGSEDSGASNMGQIFCSYFYVEFKNKHKGRARKICVVVRHVPFA